MVEFALRNPIGIFVCVTVFTNLERVDSTNCRQIVSNNRVTIGEINLNATVLV